MQTLFGTDTYLGCVHEIKWMDLNGRVLAGTTKM